MAENILSISLKDYKKQIEELKGSLLNLQHGSEAYNKVLNEVQSRQDKLNQVMSDTKSKGAAAEGSYRALSEEMSNLKKAWKETADEMERDALGQQINNLNNQLKELDASIGNYQRNVGNYTNAFVDGLSKLNVGFAGTLKSAIATGNGIKTAFSKNPYIVAITVAITALVGVFRTLKNAINSNEQTQRKWKEAMATLQPVINALKNVIDKVATAIVNFVAKIMEYIPKGFKVIGEFVKNSGKKFADFIRSVGKIASAVAGIIQPIAKVFGKVLEIVSAAVKKIAEPIASLLETVGLDGLAAGLRRISEVGANVISTMAAGYENLKGTTEAVFDTMASGVENVTSKIGNWSIEMGNATKHTQDLAKAQDDLAKQSKETQTALAENNAEIAKLRDEVAKEKDPAKRAALLAKQQELIKKNGQMAVDLAKRRYELESQIAELAPNSVEDNQRLVDLKTELYNTEAAYYQQLVKTDKQLTSIEAKEEKGAKTTTSAGKAATKAAKEAEKAEANRLALLKVTIAATEKAAKNEKEMAEWAVKVEEAQGKISKVETSSKRIEINKKYNESLAQTKALYDEMLKSEKLKEEERIQLAEKAAALELEIYKNMCQQQIDEANRVNEAIKAAYDARGRLSSRAFQLQMNDIDRQAKLAKAGLAAYIDNYKVAEDEFRFYIEDTSKKINDDFLLGTEAAADEIMSRNPLGHIMDRIAPEHSEVREILFGNMFSAVGETTNEFLEKFGRDIDTRASDAFSVLISDYKELFEQLLSFNEEAQKEGMNLLDGFDYRKNVFDIDAMQKYMLSRLNDYYKSRTDLDEGYKKNLRDNLIEMGNNFSDFDVFVNDTLKQLQTEDFFDPNLKKNIPYLAVLGEAKDDILELKNLFDDLGSSLKDIGIEIDINNFDDFFRKIMDNVDNFDHDVKTKLLNALNKYRKLMVSYGLTESKAFGEINALIVKSSKKYAEEQLVETQRLHDVALDQAKTYQEKLDEIYNTHKENRKPSIETRSVQQSFDRMIREFAGSYQYLTDELKEEFEALQNDLLDVSDDDYEAITQYYQRLVDFAKKVQNEVKTITDEKGHKLKTKFNFENTLEDVKEDVDDTYNYLKEKNKGAMIDLYMSVRVQLRELSKMMPEETKVIFEQLDKAFDDMLLGNLSPQKFGELLSNFYKQAGATAKEKVQEAFNEPIKLDMSFDLSEKMSVFENFFGDFSDDFKKYLADGDVKNVFLYFQEQLAKVPENLKPEMEEAINAYMEMYIEYITFRQKYASIEAQMNNSQQFLEDLKANGKEASEEYQNELLKYQDYREQSYNLQVEWLSKEAELRKKFDKKVEDVDKKNFENITKKKKAYLDLFSSIGKLMGNISEIFEEYIKEREKQGKITEEQAKKEFETVKALQIAEATISTIAGATQAFMQTWGDKTIQPTWLKAALAVTNAASVTAAGVANIAKIAHTEYGSSSASGAATATAGMTSAIYQGVTADPLLNETLDERNLSQLDIETRSTKEQRVYILQSDISDSESQVRIRQNQSTF